MSKKSDLNIILLPKEQWEGTAIPMRYTTEEYYDVSIEKGPEGCRVDLCRRRFDKPVSHYPEEYDFPDKLYQPHWEKACAWGIVEERDGKKELLACIETCPEEWSNRLMVTELWVAEELRRQGVGHRLMAIAKEQAAREKRRAVILETQSCNVGAISFYQQEGFGLIGFDSCCYSNSDLERKEVRLDMGYFPGQDKNVASQNTVHLETAKNLAEGLAFGRAAKEDKAEILALYRSLVGTAFCAWTEDYPGEQDVDGDLARDGLFCLKDAAGKIIGAISIDQDEQVENLPCWSKELMPAAELSRLGVRPEYQNQGIARQLLGCGMEELKRQGKKGVHFLVCKTNRKAIRSYDKLNFNVVGECQVFGEEWWCYEKGL